MFNKVEHVIGTRPNGYSGCLVWKTTFDSSWEIGPVNVVSSSFKGPERLGMICYLDSKFLQIKIEVWDDAPEYKSIVEIIKNKNAEKYVQFCMSHLTINNILNIVNKAYENGVKTGKKIRSQEFLQLLDIKDNSFSYGEH